MATYVKIRRAFEQQADGCRAERFWLELTGEGVGIVANDLHYTHVHNIKRGDEVRFTNDEVLDATSDDQNN